MDKLQNPPSPLKQAERFPVSVLMNFLETQNNPWSSGQWQATGLVVGEAVTSQTLTKQVIRSDTQNTQFLWSGFSVELFKDDAESYYHNLMSDNPKAFIICSNDEESGDQCRPFLVTLSYDEATSYMEVDELVYSVGMPAELYRWVEQFVLEHYVPVKKTKRRRANWKETAQ
jgi:hypothetical protein